MRLQPVIYTTDPDRSAVWYATLFGADPVVGSEMWVAFAVGDATLGLHRVETLPARGRVELSVVYDGSLEELVERLGRVGVLPTDPIREQPFGRSVVFTDPDGTPVQVNEHIG